MVATEMGDLAESYLREYGRSRAAAATGRKLDPHDPDAQAFDRVLDFVLTDDVEALQEVNIELVRRCQSIDELSYVAAGPVEDLLNRLGDDEVDAVLRRASEDPRWKYAIAGTYTSRMTTRLAAAIEKIRRENTAHELAAATRLSL
jgi:hypothetical protein